VSEKHLEHQGVRCCTLAPWSLCLSSLQLNCEKKYNIVCVACLWLFNLLGMTCPCFELSHWLFGGYNLKHNTMFLSRPPQLQTEVEEGEESFIRVLIQEEIAWKEMAAQTCSVDSSVVRIAVGFWLSPCPPVLLPQSFPWATVFPCARLLTVSREEEWVFS
jgi:hypothetical protein